MTQEEQAIYCQAKYLAEQFCRILDEQKTSYEITMTALGYAINIIVQGQALLNKKDTNEEVMHFAQFLVAAGQTFKVTPKTKGQA